MPRDEGDSGRGGAAAWVRRWWRALAAELLATALLVVLGLASLMPRAGDRGGPPVSPPLTHPALAFAFVVVGNAMAFGAASGAHMNPAVTLAAALYGQLGAAPALAYAGAQLAGATLGMAALLALAPAHALASGRAGVTLPAAGVSPLAAAGVEALLTGALALACCGAWAAHDPARPDPAVPLKLGLLVGGLVYAGGEMTGASLNPARSLAPALLQNEWTHHWVYWVGPLGGAAVCALLQRWVLLPPPAPASASASASAPAPASAAAYNDAHLESLPLQDKPDH